MSVTHVSNDFLKLIDQVAEDGELTFREIRELAVWINKNKEGRKLWPATVFIKLLQNVFADGKIDANEANEVGKLIQAVRREWSRNIVTAKPVSTESVVANAISRVDVRLAVLPAIAMSVAVPSESELDTDYIVDFNGPTCTCPDFRSNRSALPIGHLSRCCKHIFQSYARLRPDGGWPAWLDTFLEMGMRPLPNHKWAVLQFGPEMFLVSSAPKDWGNVYTKSIDGNKRFGYSITEDRWAYGIAPAHAQQLSAAIVKLTNQSST